MNKKLKENIVAVIGWTLVGYGIIWGGQVLILVLWAADIL